MIQLECRRKRVRYIDFRIKLRFKERLASANSQQPYCIIKINKINLTISVVLSRKLISV